MGEPKQAWIDRHQYKPSTSKPSLEALLKSTNAIAGGARNLFITYILLALYIFLTVGATNDEQLFRDSSIAVPLLSNINLPVSKFYLFVPWMFVLVHVDLLILHKLLGDKLHALNAELDRMKPAVAEGMRQQLPGLPYVHWVSGSRSDSFGRFITGLLVWTAVLALPLLALLALQIGALPFHSTAANFSQKMALSIDVLLLLWFWPPLVAGTPERTWRWWLPGGELRRTACAGICRSASGTVLAGSVLLGWFVLVLPGERLEDDGAILHWLLDDVATVKPGDEEIRQAAKLPWYSLQKLEIGWRGWFARQVEPHLPLFHRNLDLHEKLLIANNLDLQTLTELQNSDLDPDRQQVLLIKVDGLDLKNRDLRFANLKQAKLWHANFSGVYLQEADLAGAQLQGIEWGRDAQLQGVNFREARVQGADLWEADLRGANLWGALLRGAHLRKARLEGTNLAEAQMQGADLWGAQLQGADLRGAQLHGANLEAAQLQGAYLWGARMQGASLSAAQLHGAYLGGAYLQGADLARAELQGANLENARLQGADLNSAQVGSASFQQAAFGLNDFRNLVTVPLGKADLDAWKTRLQSLRAFGDRAKDQAAWLESRVDRSPEFPVEGAAPPCLSDAPRSGAWQRCQDANAGYFDAVTKYLGDLACGTDRDTEWQEFIARGLARRTIHAGDSNADDAAARRKLAARLLQADCAGKMGLNDALRTDLRKLVENP